MDCYRVFDADIPGVALHIGCGLCQRRVYGVASDGERIKLRYYSFKALRTMTFADMKTLALVQAYFSHLAKRKEMIDKSGQMGVPVIYVGDELTVGFDEDRLRSLLAI